MFNEGEEYKRSHLHDKYGGNRQSGIASCAKHGIVLLFTGVSGKEYGYEDGWNGKKAFFYTGEGQIGNMEFKRGNKAIRDHIQNGKTLHLFQQLGNSYVNYLGEMEYKGNQIKEGFDKNKNKRDIIVFELTKID